MSSSRPSSSSRSSLPPPAPSDSKTGDESSIFVSSSPSPTSASASAKDKKLSKSRRTAPEKKNAGKEKRKTVRAPPKSAEKKLEKGAASASEGGDGAGEKTENSEKTEADEQKEEKANDGAAPPEQAQPAPPPDATAATASAPAAPAAAALPSIPVPSPFLTSELQSLLSRYTAATLSRRDRTALADALFHLFYSYDHRLASLSSAQSSGDHLRVLVSELEGEVEKLQRSRSQIHAHLNGQLKMATRKTEELLREMEAARAAATRREAEYERRLADTDAAHERELSARAEALARAEADYATLADFRDKKAELERQLKAYSDSLNAERHEHARDVSELERRNVMEKDRLKNEMLKKIRETKLSLLAMTEDQLHTTTKRTIMENEMMTTELQYQSKETEKMIRRNERLQQEKRQLTRELEMAREKEKMMAKRNNFFKNLIAKMQKKMTPMLCDAMDQEIRDEDAKDARLTVKLPQVPSASAPAAAVAAVGAADPSLSKVDRSERAFEDFLLFQKLADKDRERERERAAVEEREERARVRVAALEERRDRLEKEKRELAERLAEREVALEMSERTNESLIFLYDDSITFILTCMEDVRQKMREKGRAAAAEKNETEETAAGEAERERKQKKGGWQVYEIGKGFPMKLTDTTMEEREEILEMLFRKLNSYRASAASLLATNSNK